MTAKAPYPQLLDGKVAIVTGGGRGVGRGEAIALAAHGAKVVVNDIEDVAEAVAAEIRAAGGEAVAHLGSVADHATAGALIQTAVDRFGRLDILVNNAGMNLPKLLDDTTPEEWRWVMDNNLTGHFNTTQHAARIMRAQNSGRIINTASGAWPSPQLNLAYAVSKAAVASFTWGVAWDLRNTAVTCNAIAPFGKTRMIEKAIRAYDEQIAAGVTPSAMRDRLINYPGPEFVAPIVIYLSSDHAAQVTGQLFRAGGGKVGVYAHPAELRSIEKDIADGEPWTVEELIGRVPKDVLAGVEPWWGR